MLEVRGMTCEHCEGAVTKALARVPGVVAVERVDRVENVAEVDVQAPLDEAALVAAVIGEGYVAAVRRAS